MSNSVLPEYISDVLPTEAIKVEQIRRRLLDLFFSYGYELVRPPLVEFIESLLVDGDQKLDLELFKLIDQLSGRLMGVRTDFKPQVARIDANFFYENSVSRLCYTGDALYARSRDMQSAREPYFLGADIFGSSGIQADIEIQQLVIASLESLEVGPFCFDLGHTGIVNALLGSSRLQDEDKNSLLRALHSKNNEQIECLTQTLDPIICSAIRELPNLSGDLSILVKAREVLPKNDTIFQAIDELDVLGRQVVNYSSDKINLSIDLAPSNWSPYQSGSFFSVYIDSLANALVTGGRYHVKTSGTSSSREATGFALDLKELVKLFPKSINRSTIIAPGFLSEQDPSFGLLPDSEFVWKALFSKIMELRNKGEIVVHQFPDQGPQKIQGTLCVDRRLAYRQGEWLVEKIV